MVKQEKSTSLWDDFLTNIAESTGDRGLCIRTISGEETDSCKKISLKISLFLLDSKILRKTYHVETATYTYVLPRQYTYQSATGNHNVVNFEKKTAAVCPSVIY